MPLLSFKILEDDKVIGSRATLTLCTIHIIYKTSRCSSFTSVFSPSVSESRVLAFSLSLLFFNLTSSHENNLMLN
ncbi:hypothetical protein LWI29_033069 [Acer saccharum]|uniref:Uncharacterized protein n=1 Tax=Acer saccharum TaxID=4024 RepID=A0AA39RP31_ACESA|nr:hypothetical protein LWI29_033069 [Acer saccharum]